MDSWGAEIKIVSVGAVEQNLLDFLALTLPGRFGGPCFAMSLNLKLKETHDRKRRQYHATLLLAQLYEISAADGGKILGVTDLDLFIPIFTFVFGQAQVGGCAALISTHRLRQEFYGLPEDPRLLFARAEKEAVHELGHAFGLAHCRSLDCVMRFSNSVEQVDLRPSHFCQRCEATLQPRSGSRLAA